MWGNAADQAHLVGIPNTEGGVAGAAMLAMARQFESSWPRRDSSQLLSPEHFDAPDSETNRHVANTRAPSRPRLSCGEASNKNDINTVEAQEAMATRFLKAFASGATQI